MSECSMFLKELVIADGWLRNPPASAEEVADIDVWFMLKEILEEAELSRDRRRHWTDVQKVSKIGDKFVSWWDCEVSGDRAAGDVGWEFDISSVQFVDRKERVITEVYYE